MKMPTLRHLRKPVEPTPTILVLKPYTPQMEYWADQNLLAISPAEVQVICITCTAGTYATVARILSQKGKILCPVCHHKITPPKKD